MKDQTTDNSNISLDPRAIHALLEAVDVATKRGAFSIQEVGNIANAYDHTATALNNLSKAHSEQAETSGGGKKTDQNKGDSE